MHIVRAVDYQAGFAIGHCLGSPTARAGYLRDTARCRLHEHNAEPLLFKATPAVATEHGVQIGTAVQ